MYLYFYVMSKTIDAKRFHNLPYMYKNVKKKLKHWYCNSFCKLQVYNYNVQ